MVSSCIVLEASVCKLYTHCHPLTYMHRLQARHGEDHILPRLMLPPKWIVCSICIFWELKLWSQGETRLVSQQLAWISTNSNGWISKPWHFARDYCTFYRHDHAQTAKAGLRWRISTWAFKTTTYLSWSMMMQPMFANNTVCGNCHWNLRITWQISFVARNILYIFSNVL